MHIKIKWLHSHWGGYMSSCMLSDTIKVQVSQEAKQKREKNSPTNAIPEHDAVIQHKAYCKSGVSPWLLLCSLCLLSVKFIYFFYVSYKLLFSFRCAFILFFLFLLYVCVLAFAFSQKLCNCSVCISQCECVCVCACYVSVFRLYTSL